MDQLDRCLPRRNSLLGFPCRQAVGLGQKPASWLTWDIATSPAAGLLRTNSFKGLERNSADLRTFAVDE
jgi:hypothetical protein